MSKPALQAPSAIRGKAGHFPRGIGFPRSWMVMLEPFTRCPKPEETPKHPFPLAFPLCPPWESACGSASWLR